MLPRQNKNATRIMIENEDDAEDIARKIDEAQRWYGISEQILPKNKNITFEKNQHQEKMPINQEVNPIKNQIHLPKTQSQTILDSLSVITSLGQHQH